MPRKKNEDYFIMLAKIVKRANQRLTQLERSGFKNSNAYRYVEKEVYRRKNYVREDTERPRFRTDIKKMTGKERQKLENEVKKFLSSRTSTVSGIKEIFNKQRENFNKKYGTSFNMKQWLDLWGNGQDQKLKTDFGYAFDFRAISDLSKQGYSTEDIYNILTHVNGMSLMEIEETYDINFFRGV